MSKCCAYVHNLPGESGESIVAARRGGVVQFSVHSGRERLPKSCSSPRSSEPMRVIEVTMEHRRIEVAGKTGDPRENPSTNGIVWQESQMQKFGDPWAGSVPTSESECDRAGELLDGSGVVK
ncbi:hypothetical protein PR048_007249 [Dryococelus australis]|uniref:Uncharacterized protein n=1 Tax=Dryococelus australis TaxID=614101 RepID=A0ABQ9ID33_9NEOP|nr:hypothetical protein PR048_007249 [Dryococelus australis]